MSIIDRLLARTGKPASAPAPADDQATQDRIAKDRIAKDRITEDRITEDRTTKDRTTKDRLGDMAGREGMLSGEDVAEDYHGRATRDMDVHWRKFLADVFARHTFDLSRSVDIAAGFGAIRESCSRSVRAM